MTPKEKAKELVEKFEPHARLIVDPGVNVGRKEHAKQCALIVVAEMKKIYARDSNINHKTTA